MSDSDFDSLYDSKYNFAAFNYESFSQSFYSMIVGVSTTSFPLAMVKAYKSSRFAAIYYIVNSFTLNIIMLNLILATFYFYYQSFYTESVKKVNGRTGLLRIMSHFKGKIIEDKQLRYIIEQYYEDSEIRFEDLNKEYFRQPGGLKSSGIDSYSILISLQGNYLYQMTKGILNIVIVGLTMNAIDIFHSTQQKKNTLVLQVQVGLIFLSMMEQSIGIVVRGFRRTFKEFLLTLDICVTLIALLIGLIFVSFDSLPLLLSYNQTSNLFKIYALATICKTLSVIMFLRVIREIRIVLDVLINSAIFLLDVIGMMGIVMLLFSSVGITMFGGVMNSKAIASYETIMGAGEGFDKGLEYLNFNDYFNALMTLFSVILAGWQDTLRMLCFANPNRSMNHNYFFVCFFICANLFLLNVLIGFIIDNIVAYLSEDITHEHSKMTVVDRIVTAIKPMISIFSPANKRAKRDTDISGIILVGEK